MRPIILSFFFGLVLLGSTLQPEPASAKYTSLHPKASVKVMQSPPLWGTVQEEEIPGLTTKAESGDTAAIFKLSRWYTKNDQKEKAASLVKELAESGNPEAQYLYAMAIQKPRLRLDDPAVAWLERAAAKEYTPALVALFEPYFHAEDVPKAIGVMRRAACLGEPVSAYFLGRLFYEGEFVPHNGVAAYTWLYLARHGYSIPYTKTLRGNKDTANLPVLDFLAWTMTLDEIRQVEAALAAWPETLPPEPPLYQPERWMESEDIRRRSSAMTNQEIAAVKREAQAGDPDAIAQLGHMYLYGLGVRKNHEKAEALLKKAGAKGRIKALLELAHLYDETKGREAGATAARKIYEPLAAKGVPEAQVALYRLLFLQDWRFPDRSEKEVKADHRMVLRYLAQAAKTGNARAMYLLGLNAEDPLEAAKWFEQAVAQGHNKSLRERIEIAQKAVDWESAYVWLTIWMHIEWPSSRHHIRRDMIKLVPRIPATEVPHLKKRGEMWLKEHPKALDHSWLRPEDGVNQSDTEGMTALHRAALEGDAGEVARLLAAGATVNILNLRGRTPLRYAIKERHLPVAKILVEAGAAVNAASNGYTPLLEAVWNGDEAAVAYLLEAGADPTINSRLWIAVIEKNMAIVRMLVEAGDDIDASSNGSKHALHVAVVNGREESLAFLLEHNANPNVRDKDGNTPLHDAATENNPAAVTLLLAAKADPTATNNDGKTPLDLAESDEVKQLLKAARDGKPKGK